MTDLKIKEPATIAPDITIGRANQTMIKQGVRLLFVVDANQAVSGLITAEDILGEKPISLSQERGIEYNQIKVADIMTRQPEIEVLNLQDVLQATVADIVATLHHVKRQHALVVDEPGGDKAFIRGIFSLSMIAGRLGVLVQAQDLDHAFGQIIARLHDRA
ncbi:MAG: CBS domain-containing protein [Deltaproteobacteria bacterium]|nr:CBS domain-containing protein [Deltaproteobacteria bacterium]